MRFLDIYFLDQKLVLTWHWQGLHKYLIFQLMDLILTLTGDLADAFVSLSRMIDDLRGSLASVQAENKVSLFFQHFSNFFWLILKSSVFRCSKIELTLWWSVMMKAMAKMMTAATVMKAITTMNNCYTGHDSYLLEWEGYISKVLINYDFFFRIWKKIWTTWRIFKASWSKTSPMYDQSLVKTFLGWH